MTQGCDEGCRLSNTGDMKFWELMGRRCLMLRVIAREIWVLSKVRGPFVAAAVRRIRVLGNSDVMTSKVLK